jgi:hypothetical protein
VFIQQDVPFLSAYIHKSKPEFSCGLRGMYNKFHALILFCMRHAFSLSSYRVVWMDTRFQL